MAKIVILSGSPRRNGNTEILVNTFVDVAQKKHSIDVISVIDYKIHPCLGCNSCFTHNNQCAQKDDMSLIYDKLSSAEILIIASPTYFYGISSQLKSIIDRLHNPIRNDFAIKKLGLILVGAASLPELFSSIEKQYELTLQFFGLEDIGRILVRNVNDKGDVRNTDAIQQVIAFAERL